MQTTDTGSLGLPLFLKEISGKEIKRIKSGERICSVQISPMKRQKRSRQTNKAFLLELLVGLLFKAVLPPFLLSGTIALSYL